MNKLLRHFHTNKLGICCHRFRAINHFQSTESISLWRINVTSNDDLNYFVQLVLIISCFGSSPELITFLAHFIFFLFSVQCRQTGNVTVFHWTSWISFVHQFIAVSVNSTTTDLWTMETRRCQVIHRKVIYYLFHFICSVRRIFL